MAAIFTGVQPDVILHCAGSANVGASVVNPMADLDGNLHSLYQLLLALKSFEKRPQIIFLSSAGIYGNPRQLPVRESDAAAPMSPYGLHKHMAEELCEYYNRIHGYRIRSIRIFSAVRLLSVKTHVARVSPMNGSSAEVSAHSTSRSAMQYP